MKINQEEEISMEQEEFVEKKAEEYIANIGEDAAIAKLSMLALKSRPAKKILDVILSRQTKSIQQPQPDPALQRDKARTQSHASDIKPTAKVIIQPKQRFLNLVNALKLSYDTPFDEAWNPIISVKWVNGHADINGRRVTFGQDFLGFMKQNVLCKERAYITMRVLNVNKHGVIVKPDVKDFYVKRQQMYNAIWRRKRADAIARRKAGQFEGTVMLRKDHRGNAIGINIVSTAVRGKRIVIPKRFLSDIMTKRGVWLFAPLDHRKDAIVVEPVEQVASPVSREDLDKRAWEVSPYHKVNAKGDSAKYLGFSKHIETVDRNIETEQEKHEDTMRKLESAMDQKMVDLTTSGKVNL